MLTPAVVRSASGAASYYATDNYYTDGQATEASLWVGQGAAALGLEGMVGQQAFEAVLAGTLPGGDTIAAGANGKHRAGLDFTFIAVETAHQRREWPDRDDVRAMHAGADRLDQLRRSGAEDVRTVLDRTPELGRDIVNGRNEAVWRAWIDEGQARAGSGADYAARFVADWRAASGELAAATGTDVGWRAERKLERLAERMDQQPALARALERQIPERQLEIDRAGMTRTRDMGMGM